MYRLRASRSSSADDRLDRQVTLRSRGGPDPHAMIGERRVQSVRVGVRIDGDGLDTHLAARADHADGDLATVRDEDLGEHHIRNTPNFGGRIGALYAAEIASANAVRVSAGSRIPSSQS